MCLVNVFPIGEAEPGCVWSMSFPLETTWFTQVYPKVSPARPCLNSLHMVQKYRNSLKLKGKKAKIIRVNTTKSNMASLLTQAQSSLAHVRVHLPFADTVPHYDVVNSTSASAGRENLCSLRKAATPPSYGGRWIPS